MSLIQVLDESTINQIAAGEVVERPSAVVKELIENAMDAGASAITAEIKEGGLSFIRITDNGFGIAKEDVPLAFLRHATSKIRCAQDLLSVTSLGFRGEALSSIAAVAQVELITKKQDALTGYRYLIEGGAEKSFDEIGCPGGTTIVVRNLFYNTPARRKFLKSATTEAGYISDLMERLMVSHPEVSFKYIVNQQVKLQSCGNRSSKDILYQVYGRDISRELVPVTYEEQQVQIHGFIGKPLINRGNRNFENYFINGRYIKSNIITKAIEEAYKPYLMQHKYPFTSLYFTIDPLFIDVNVHPQKLEVRLKNADEIFQSTLQAIRTALTGKELIPKVSLTHENNPQKQEVITPIPEPFETNRIRQMHADNVLKESNSQYFPSDKRELMPSNSTSANLNPAARTYVQDFDDQSYDTRPSASDIATHATLNLDAAASDSLNHNVTAPDSLNHNVTAPDSLKHDVTAADISKTFVAMEPVTLDPAVIPDTEPKQFSLFSEDAGPDAKKTDLQKGDPVFLSKRALEEHRIIGQIFSTYWLVEYKKELYIIDQHAAHEKILYESIMEAARKKTASSQLLLPPIVLTLTLREQEVLKKYVTVLEQLGYEIEHFGGNEYSVRAVPADLYGLSEKELLLEFIDKLTEDFSGSTPDAILERVASLSCKAAVKANHNFSLSEASALISTLLTLNNPYHCPHGRPVIVSMSQYELEKKFKRIL